MTDRHENIQVLENVEEFALVELRQTKRYGHAHYIFLGIFNGLGHFVPLVELTKFRQNAWNSRGLPCISAEVLKQAAQTARKRAESLIFMGRDDVAAIFRLRYRQKMTANRPSALEATDSAVSRLALKTVGIADFSSILVELAIHGQAPNTLPLEGDTWKIVKIFRALCAL